MIKPKTKKEECYVGTDFTTYINMSFARKIQKYKGPSSANQGSLSQTHINTHPLKYTHTRMRAHTAISVLSRNVSKVIGIY